LPDRIHPHAAAKKILAENIWQVLEPIANEMARVEDGLKKRPTRLRRGFRLCSLRRDRSAWQALTCLAVEPALSEVEWVTAATEGGTLNVQVRNLGSAPRL